jgi:hypothetical protein
MAYDIQRAIARVDSIPLIKESIPELTKLANGFDPEIPGYLALGKLHQITNLAEHAQSAKPPQGTIKDKTTQAAGLMALMGGRGAQAAQQSQAQSMNQPGGPVPEGVPQPEMQGEEDMADVMTAADGGIMRAEIDPNIFRFDGGGIVSFSKGSKKPVEEKEDTTSALGDLVRAIFGPIGEGIQQTADYGKTMAQRNEATPGLLEQLTPSQRAERLRQVQGLNRELTRVANPVDVPAVTPQQQAAADAETQRLALNANARQQPTIMNENPDLVPGVPTKPEAAPVPPKPPMGGINDGKTPVPGANIPAIGGIKPEALPENKFLNMTEQFINQKPEEFNEAAEAAKLKARNEAAGIGTYAKVMRDQQAKLRDQFNASRPTLNEDIVGALRRYARPGAMAGDVGDEINTQMRTEREARMAFEQDQFKVTEAIEKLEEARRTGDVQAIGKAEADLKKANADLRNHQMTAASSAASTLGKAQEGAADRAQHLAIENAKLAIEKAKLAQLSKDSETIKLMKEVEALEKAGHPEEALKKLELYGKVNALKMGAKYEGKSGQPTPKEINDAIEKAYKTRNQMDFLVLGNKNAKPADIARAQANIERTKNDVIAQLGGGASKGGGAKPITKEEYDALPKGATYTAPDGSQRVKG